MRALVAAALLLLATSASEGASQQADDDRAGRFDSPGLELAFRSAATGETDVRAARLAALYVPDGQPPTPFLDAGPFEATFRGAVELDLNDRYRFTVRGAGAVRLSVGGEAVLERESLPPGGDPASTDGEVRLHKGLNPIELVYRSPASGDASLRLTWSNDYLPEEPLPPESLRRAASAGFDRGAARREARDLATAADAAAGHPRHDFDPRQTAAIERFLAEDAASLSRFVPAEFAERAIRDESCLACHARDGAAASSPPPAAGRADEPGPGLPAPDLTWAGEKLRSDWLADFLAGHAVDRPRPHLPAPMPSVSAHAGALAAGLHHQHGLPASPPTVEPVDEDLAAIGRDLVGGDRLGCHSCHALGDEPALGGEGSEEAIDLALVRRRLRRPFFDRFLLDPQRILPGTKMPQFVDEDGYTALYDVFDGEAERQFDAIWQYLGTLD